ncbi:MAG: response regulator [Verrucomicrobiota bacterium]
MKTTRLVNIASVEDNRLIRQRLVGWVTETPGYKCVFDCGTAEEALAELPKIAPDIVLMDIHLPNLSGIACTSRLRELLPTVQILIVTVYRDYDKIFQSLKAGASGYLLKRSTKDELIHAIGELRSGGAPMTSEIARRLVESFRETTAASVEASPLTRREREILDLLCEGMSNKEISQHLHIGLETIRTHLKHIYERLHVRSRTEAAMKYREDYRGGSA